MVDIQDGLEWPRRSTLLHRGTQKVKKEDDKELTEKGNKMKHTESLKNRLSQKKVEGSDQIQKEDN